VRQKNKKNLTVIHDQATWEDAFSFCGKIGMSLMTIPNREKQAALAQYGI
jgi:hypothetical protein